MAESKIVINRPSSASTPPNCAICLGSCTNKCFSDSCMHQFCFKCLLEWSKIKAECPLCKQRFKSIIHNVKSNEEYDEYVVQNTRNEDVRLISNEEFLFVPLSITPQRHEFHVRTTFTVDSRGEHAIQQMLLSHPLTSGRLTSGAGYHSNSTFPRSSRFRRSVYENNMWVHCEPDVSGYYRECTPEYFRNNPAATQRILQWLYRELTALFRDDTRLISHLEQIIMTNILRHHVCSLTFRNSIRQYLDVRTDHFAHELYNFMRSPYDMYGYDRSVIYTCGYPTNPSPFFDDTVEVPDDNSDDSDVVLVSATHPSEPVTINLVDTDSDEPIMISPCNEVPMPIISPSRRNSSTENPGSVGHTVVNLPPKLRHKHEAIQDKEKLRWIKKKRTRRSSSSSSSNSSSDERNKESYKKYKMRKALKKSKHKKRQEQVADIDTDNDVNITSSDSDTDDNKPLIDILKKKCKTKEKKSKKGKRRRSKHHDGSRRRDDVEEEESQAQLQPMDLSMDAPSCSRYSDPLPDFQTSADSLQPSQLKIKFETSANHIPAEASRTFFRTKESINNGQHTNVESVVAKDMSVSGKKCDPVSNGQLEQQEPCSSKTKNRVIRNGRNSPKHSKTKSEREECCSGAEDYRIPSVKSEIREVKYDNPGPSTSKSLPLIFKREHNKWYVFGETDSSD
ncbi:hypothetical protein GWI33_021200 [Rhynchophorus ferrugineus]|uniref:E3 ubiquitin-protein ligase Topors n=1 Tax=Rhynchophorus ferrugineus TaxID=354439 RepID=A0A834M2M4_RHYFE|nr:hypothetical protein GWI33_021200 [Rhynchophorus ferrugineus]